MNGIKFIVPFVFLIDQNVLVFMVWVQPQFHHCFTYFFLRLRLPRFRSLELSRKIKKAYWIHPPSPDWSLFHNPCLFCPCSQKGYEQLDVECFFRREKFTELRSTIKVVFCPLTWQETWAFKLGQAVCWTHFLKITVSLRTIIPNLCFEGFWISLGAFQFKLIEWILQ